ncbi:ABC transporter related [Candidatus Desulforudis audaxviator MP104C]|uniref:ABC transporter related n=2 Tax=Candidatus Desulforudis TaxID=471826 RepID=B1I2H0_DESAP|nr:ABC transporter related [Candidatus Desulforudis audaxviator MP104C]AZK59278.1 Branched-chain amino acid transport ATP-binding protein LivF [Candidatus Desulforudis audaxviator]
MMLAVKDLTVSRGHIRVLNGLTFSVSAGEIVAVLGANGAGKSTLVGTLAGLYPPSAGEIIFQNQTLTGRSPEAVVHAGISLVPEHRQLFGGLSVRDNLILGAYHRYRAAKKELPQLLEDVYRLFPALREKQHKPAQTLSGGLQQMLAIGRGLMAAPRLLLLDEPSVGLAPLVVREIMTTLSELRAKGQTIILVEQNARAALRIADRAWVLERGRIALSDTAEKLREDARIQSAYLGRRP